MPTQLNNTRVLLIVNNFVGGINVRVYIDPFDIRAIQATGTGMNSRTDIILSSGAVVQTAVWDTEWPAIFTRIIPAALAAHDGSLYCFVKFDRREPLTQDILNNDKQERFGISPYNRDV
jgi:hypothetical protein